MAAENAANWRNYYPCSCLRRDCCRPPGDFGRSVYPGAWTELALACPECGHRWTETFDIVSFLWAELDSCAHRLVGDVHSLASAYGWRESDVLALSPSRRQAYLELVPR